MDPEQIIRSGIAAMEAHDLEKSFQTFSDDVVISGANFPQPLNKQEFMAQNADLLTAFPDWKFNIQSVTVQGNHATVKVRPSGTQSGPLKLPMPGAPTIPPTGKKVSYSDQFSLTFKGDKVVEMRFETPANGGLQAMLQQLGVQLPPQ